MGLAISNALEVCQFLKHATRMTLELEKSFSGVERLVEYAESLPREPSDGAPLPALNWPTAGGIVAKGLCVRYRPELPHALRDVSCSIAPRSKVGIVPNPSPTPDPNPNPNLNPNPNSNPSPDPDPHPNPNPNPNPNQGGHRGAYRLGQVDFCLGTVAAGAARGLTAGRRH